MEKIAEINGLDVITTWSIILDDMEDLERYKLFGNTKYANDKNNLMCRD